MHEKFLGSLIPTENVMVTHSRTREVNQFSLGAFMFIERLFEVNDNAAWSYFMHKFVMNINSPRQPPKKN